MAEWARGFGDYVAAIAGGVGVAIIAALILLALSRVTFPSLRHLWHRASPLGRLFGTLLFLICSINATTKAPSRTAPKRVAASVAAASQSQPTRIEKWFRRGAWRDDHYLKFDTDWVFPHGTNHYSGIWIYSWGKLAAPRTRQAFAALGTDLALFPEESEVTWERTSSNSYRIAWQNGFPDRRSRENGMSASFELFRNGDIAITTNNVTRYIERELPFDCVGRGQDTTWVAANYPNDAQAIANAGGYAAWVAKCVEEDAYDGYFALTVSCDTPLEAILLTVGDQSVVIEEAGEYVFLLEKGRKYEISLSDDLPNVRYNYSSVKAKARRALLVASVSALRASGSAGEYSFSAPIGNRKGWILCLPAFIIVPEWVEEPSFPVQYTGYLTVPGGAAENIVWQSDRGIVEKGAQFTLEADAIFDRVNVRVPYGQSEFTGAIVYEHPYSVASLYMPNHTVIREAAYTNTPSEIVESKTSVLNVSALWKVITDGVMRLEGEGIDSIIIGDEAKSLPYEWKVYESYESESFMFGIKDIADFEGRQLHLTFTPDVATQYAACSDSLTLSGIKEYIVSVKADANFPENKHRHVFGPNETARLTISPTPNALCWRQDEMVLDDKRHCDFTAPGMPCESYVNVYADGATYSMKFSTIAPTHHKAIDCFAQEPADGGIGVELLTELKLMPDYVSFEKLAVKEEVCDATGQTGVFALPGTELLPHDKDTGALNEVNVQSGNFVGSDRAMTSLMMSPPWREGRFQYDIPEYWRLQEGDQTWHYFHTESQINTFSTNGVYRITKYGVTAARKEYDEAIIEEGVKNE